MNDKVRAFHEGVRGSYERVMNIPDAHPDSLYFIATGKNLAEKDLRSFTHNDLLFMYECVVEYGLKYVYLRPHRKERMLRNREILAKGIVGHGNEKSQG